MSLTKLFPAGDGKIGNLFLQCTAFYIPPKLTIDLRKKLQSVDHVGSCHTQAFIFEALNGQWTMSGPEPLSEVIIRQQ
jgi:hypothetical protein